MANTDVLILPKAQLGANCVHEFTPSQGAKEDRYRWYGSANHHHLIQRKVFAIRK